MEKTKTSDAQKRATIKYIAEKRDRLTLNAPKGHRPAWEQAAAACGLSLSGWTIRALDAAAAQVLQDQQTGTSASAERPEDHRRHADQPEDHRHQRRAAAPPVLSASKKKEPAGSNPGGLACACYTY